MNLVTGRLDEVVAIYDKRYFTRRQVELFLEEDPVQQKRDARLLSELPRRA